VDRGLSRMRRSPTTLTSLAAGLAMILCAACGGSTAPVGAGSTGNAGGAGTTNPPANAGSLALFAGNPVDGGIVDGAGEAARFVGPAALAIDAGGNLYVAATCAIRKLTAAGVASLFAGSYSNCGSLDGSAFPSASAIAAAPDGRLFIVSGRNVIEVGPAGAMRTLAVLEPGNLGGGIAVDGAGNLIVATGIGTRRIAPSGVSTMLEGVAGADGGSGTYAMARRGVAADAAGNVYLAALDNTIVRIDSAGNRSVLAGTPNTSGTADGSGAAARFGKVVALALDSLGNLYAADAGADGQLIRKITASGVVSTVAGKPGVAALQPGALPGGLAPLGGLAFDGKGSLYASSGNAIARIALP